MAIRASGYFNIKIYKENFVWNERLECAFKVMRREQCFVAGYDLDAWAAGATGLALPAATIQCVLEEYAGRRRQRRKRRLTWCNSLGQVPFKVGQAVYRQDQLKFASQFLLLWDWYGLGQDRLRAGSFSEYRHQRGRWYLTITVNVEPLPCKTTA